MHVFICTWVSVFVRTGGCTCVCVVLADGRTKVGTNECMLNTSRTHVRAKEVRCPLFAFSLKNHFYNISMTSITQEVRCINFPLHIPKSVVSF